jgi:hypothetical protein
MLDERPDGGVSVEAHAVEIVSFTLIPDRGRNEVDDRRDRGVRAAT